MINSGNGGTEGPAADSQYTSVRKEREDGQLYCQHQVIQNR